MVHEGAGDHHQPHAQRAPCDAGTVTSSGAASIDCRCRLCEPDADVHDDEQETRALDIIGRHGWLVTAIEAADGIPGWAFTTGLTHSFGWPELAMTGLPTATLHACLNEVAGRARDGVPYGRRGTAR